MMLRKSHLLFISGLQLLTGMCAFASQPNLNGLTAPNVHHASGPARQGPPLFRGNSAPLKIGTQLQIQNAIAHNILYQKSKRDSGFQNAAVARAFLPLKPVRDDEKFKYLIMSADLFLDSANFKSTIAKNLPEDMNLILITTSGSAEEARTTFGKWISPNRIKIISLPQGVSGNSVFWARDWLPYPVYRNSSQSIGIVSTLYDQHRGIDFNASSFKSAYAKNLNAPINSEDFYFVGGNLLADDDGTCFAVKSTRYYKLNSEILKNSYGCQKTVELPHVSGIGDVDEVIKVLPNKVILTQIPQYKPILEKLGYQVEMLPGVDDNESNYGIENLGTYANSVILDKKVFMPSYQKPSDNVAKKVYEKFGYEVFKADSSTLSFSGLGSFHCSTMAYPNIDLDVLAELIGGKVENLKSFAFQTPQEIFKTISEFLL